MDIPTDRFYSDYHLWVKLEEGTATVGITEHAREELGDVDYVELPQEGDTITRGMAFGIIETSKAVTDLMAPISGQVVESNVSLLESPEALMDSPYTDGWLIVVEPADQDEFTELMDSSKYREFLDEAIDQ
ncbi:MAG: glycine cleavage system protein [Thermodesulfobacteriota bacterium]|nr:glycine cleavage system protein [Thermodesulfobacteriota bacterium]